ncbi:peptidoglycan-binding protein [Sphingobium sp. DEHP117]|uniref:peptidoglycan-binding protein n=1 Tax=Sphingobium sp. DEHP117 TaxID=2993436 RepID=UPI0027D5A569|nr:peptidoglycan-binding protein [Sphingobium sp. DEHP117]MDQ4421167.1 peptidoglycan-binding protein [Sphingobium sp. DEHP117]
MRPDLAALSVGDRTRALVSAARSEMDGRLWRAALGEAGGGSAATAPASYTPQAEGLDALLRQTVGTLPALNEPPRQIERVDTAQPQAASTVSLAPANARYGGMLDAAAARTGIAASTLSAIIGAEAGRRADGGWNPLSRNPRSSAAGLGQFLSGTWLGLARQKDSWLNHYARERGWTDAAGHVVPGAKPALLALRYEPQVAIESVADYARATVARLRAAGVAVGEGAAEVTRAAYIGHHLGPGDALRFYRGELTSARARSLLSAQIGAEQAELRIARAGDAAQAHRGWLMEYIARNIG